MIKVTLQQHSPTR